MMNLESFLPKLPLIKNWIDQTLAAHSRDKRSVADFGFKRLPNYYSGNLLARAKVVSVEHVPIPPLTSFGLPELGDFERGDYTGITFMDTYFVKATHADDESLHFHELVHVVQWTHLGAERFLLAYATGLATNGYRDNPLETMAYNLQSYFDQNGKPRDVEVVVRNKLNELHP